MTNEWYGYMVKKKNLVSFIAIIIISLIMPGCFDDSGGSNSAEDLLSLLAAGGAGGSIVVTIQGMDEAWHPTGFLDLGSGDYQMAAHNSTRQFWIILESGHAPGTYDQNQVAVKYLDASGVLWETDTGHAYSVTLTGWEGKGGYASGTCSGTLLRSGGGATISAGADFVLKILN